MEIGMEDEEYPPGEGRKGFFGLAYLIAPMSQPSFISFSLSPWMALRKRRYFLRPLKSGGHRGQ
jgi:hypothetical protein